MSAFLVYIFKVALLTAVFVLLYHLLLRRDTFHRTARIVLVSSLVISYILPFCVITIHRPAPVVENPEVAAIQAPAAVPATPTRHIVQPDIQPGERQIRQEQNQIEEQVRIQALPQQEVRQAVVFPDSNQSLPVPARKHMDWILVSIIIYALGVVCLIILRLLSAVKVIGIIHRGRTIVKKDGCRIVISSDDIRPFSWMNSIVLPEDMAQSESLWNSAAVRHEQSHVSHHHSIELLAIDILSAFQWFNPAVWLLRHDLCCVQEFQADASVLESGLDKLEYEKSLLSIATGGLSIPLVNGLGESYLRARIRMMNRNISRKGNLLKLIYLPLVMVVALALISNTVYDKAETDNTDFEADAYPEHDFIDLGLSVNWALCNIGESDYFPEWHGNLYAWGESVTRDYDLENHFASRVSYYFDNRITVLEPQDDAATLLWGEDWRMPTKEEFQELVDKCQWEWTQENGHYGYRVTGRNGNSIFLPSGGMKIENRWNNYPEGLYYWTSSCNSDRPSGEPKAYMFYSVSDGDDINKNRRMGVVITPLSLQIGRSVRPVTEQRFIPIQGIALNRNDIELEIGQEYKLKASFIPSDATRKRIFWYSGNSAVAKVDAHGKVTAISNGECTIKAVCGDFKVECQVTVRNPKGYIPPKQVDAVTIFRFGEEVNREFIDSLQDDYDDSMLETEEVFKTRIGDASGGITVTLFNYTDKDWNNDPGDFRIIDIDVAGRHYRFRNVDWVWEEMFDNGYFHCCKVSDSRYLLFLKGFDYGCCPGTLTVFAIDETGVYPVMNKEYHLREFNREPFSMTVADWYDEYVSDGVTSHSTTYNLFIEDGALKKRWVQLYPNKHEYVDLGLSVNWATCNIGADKPEEYGDYFAWGEMAPHYKSGYAQEEPQEHWNSYMSDGYWWSTYMWSKDTHSSLTKYCNAGDLGNNGFTDKMTELVPADDAARMLWGSKWRMPTKLEMEELFNKCTWTWTKENGVYGYRVTSNVSGYTDRSIFLPAAGIRGGKSLNGLDSDGMYWSSSLDTDNSLMAWSIFFVNGNLEGIDDDVSVAPFSRHNGQSIRPVFPTGKSHKEVYESNNEPIAYGTEVESEVLVADESPESVEPEASQMVTARFDGSIPESQLALISYQDDKVMPQSLPDIILDSLKKQYPELNTLESIFDDDGVKTNNKAYKGYLNFIRVSNSVYEFWIAGIEEKGGKAVTIEMGSIDDAITILENLITSYKQGNTIEIGGYSFTGVKGKAYSIPRNDGSDSGPYLVSVKNLKHDLSVLEKRKKMPIVGYDEVGFFTEENKPDQYVVAGRSQSAFISEADYGVIGEKGADLTIERMIRERAAGTTGMWERFNGVILGPLRHSEHMGFSGERYTNYARSYIPIIYDPEKYQAPLTDYQRSLKRSVFRRK